MKHVLKITLAVAALQLIAAFTPVVHAGGAGAPPVTPGDASAVRGAGRHRAQASRARRPRAARRRAGDALMAGVWGGEHIRFEVTEGGANVEYDCAHGTVGGRIEVDGRGRFSVAGTHYEEHGGPVRAGESGAGYPVRLSGTVGGSLMKLTVTRADTKETIGTYALRRDAAANLIKCR